MNILNENDLYFLLFGFYLLYLYFDSKFKGYIFIAILVLSLPFLKFIHVKPIKLLIFAVLMGIAFIVGMVEIDKFKKLGIDIYRPTKRNIIVALALIGLFMTIKLLYFNN